MRDAIRLERFKKLAIFGHPSVLVIWTNSKTGMHRSRLRRCTYSAFLPCIAVTFGPYQKPLDMQRNSMPLPLSCGSARNIRMKKGREIAVPARASEKERRGNPGVLPYLLCVR
jgi:hypothetical protein